MTSLGRTYSVREFGAAGDGVTDDTRAIQRAIDACGGAGGGTVYVPPGVYFSATLNMRSYVTLYLEANARLLISPGPEGYPDPGPDSYVRTLGSNCERIFLHGKRIEQAALRGSGVIDGHLGDNNDEKNSWEGITILFEQCKGITVEGIEIVRAPNWTLAFFGCNHVNVFRLRILDSRKDGINPVCCQNVLIDGVYIRGTYDDPICIKNESPGYLYETRPDCGFLSENILVANAVVEDTHGHPAVKIGTGTAGVFRNILVHDCVFNGTGAAFCIQLVRPDIEGQAERLIENVRLSNLAVRNCDCLIDVTELDVNRPIIRNLTLQNVTAQGLKMLSRIRGTKDAPIGRVELRDLFFDRAERMDCLLEAAWVDGLTVDGAVTERGRSGAAGPCGAVLSLENCRRVRAGGFVTDGGLTALALRGPYTEDIFLCDDGTAGYGAADPASGQAEETGALADALTVSAGTPDGAVFPRVSRFCLEAFEGPGTVRPGEPVAGTLRIRNEGGSGYWSADITADGAVLAPVRMWLRRDEIRTVPFFAGPLYRPGAYRIGLAQRQFRLEVLPAAADIRLDPRFEIGGKGDRLEFRLRAFNAGGAAGEKLQELRRGGKLLDAGVFRLGPGEGGELLLKTDGPETEEPYVLPGAAEWGYRLASNTFAGYEAEENRIAITAGGKQYTTVGDFEKENLVEYAALYKRVAGDFTATVRLLSQEPSGQYAFAGLIVCNDMSRAEREKGLVLLTSSPKYGSMGLWRADCDGDGRTEAIEYGSLGPGEWMRIVKTGKSFQAFVSGDGKNWKAWRVLQVDAAAGEQDVGLFAYANSAADRPGRAEFSDLSIRR